MQLKLQGVVKSKLQLSYFIKAKNIIVLISTIRSIPIKIIINDTFLKTLLTYAAKRLYSYNL